MDKDDLTQFLKKKRLYITAEALYVKHKYYLCKIIALWFEIVLFSAGNDFLRCVYTFPHNVLEGRTPLNKRPIEIHVKKP
jgi:hypothetical protein